MSLTNNHYFLRDAIDIFFTAAVCSEMFCLSRQLTLSFDLFLYVYWSIQVQLRCKLIVIDDIFILKFKCHCYVFSFTRR